MNIVYLIRSFHRYRGGIESYVYRMAKVLAEKNHLVFIIVLSGEEKFYLEPIHHNVSIRKIDFNPDPFKGYWLLDKLLPLKELRYSKAVFEKIIEISKKVQIDIIQVPSEADGFFLSLGKRFPLVARLHNYSALTDDYFSSKLKNSLRKVLIWWMQRYLYLNANALTVVSNDYMLLAKKIWRIDREISVIHNGIDRRIFSPKKDEQREKQIIFAGRLEVNKGIDLVLKCIPAVLSKHPGVRFIFAGRGEEHWLKSLAMIGGPSEVKILGQISPSDLVALYQRSIIGLFPSRYEAGGTSAMEAMSCGCVPVATSVGGFPELIKHGVNGLLIPPQDPKALGDAILRLLDNSSLLEGLSNNAIEDIKNTYDIEKNVDKTLELYAKAIKVFKTRQKFNRL